MHEDGGSLPNVKHDDARGCQQAPTHERQEDSHKGDVQHKSRRAGTGQRPCCVDGQNEEDGDECAGHGGNVAWQRGIRYTGKQAGEATRDVGEGVAGGKCNWGHGRRYRGQGNAGEPYREQSGHDGRE